MNGQICTNMVSEMTDGTVTVRAENIGGITDTEVTLSPGVTLLVGRNATNRTSFLQSIMAAIGSDRVSLKGDSEEGRATITIDNETYTRTISRREGQLMFGGDPYLENPILGDLFAFLLETNEARQAVSRGDDLRDIIMRPVDVDEIEAQIDRLLTERKRLEDELAELDDLKGTLPDLEQQRYELETDIDAVADELEATEAKIESLDESIEAMSADSTDLEEALDALRAAQSELDETRYDLETERESLEALQSERANLASELGALPEEPAEDQDEIDDQIRRLRTKKQDLITDINSLQSAIGLNEELVDGASGGVFDEVLADQESDGPVTDRLLEDRAVTCWTCGQAVETDRISDTVGRLRDISQRKLAEVDDLEEDITELEETRRAWEKSRQDRERLTRQLERVDDEIEDAKATIERLQERTETLIDEIEEAEADVEDLENGPAQELLPRHREANELEYRLGRLESDLDRVTTNIATIEDRLDQEDDIEAKLKEVQSEIGHLRTHIEEVERSAVESFNEHIDEVLSLLEYENLERIWLEQVQRTDERDRLREPRDTFELHVVRATPTGATYEDKLDHLSESEREVVGLIFALAGYLAHDVSDRLPFMLLDSLEAIDAERIATLVDYLDEIADYMVVALLPEEASALPQAYDRISDI